MMLEDSLIMQVRLALNYMLHVYKLIHFNGPKQPEEVSHFLVSVLLSDVKSKGGGE